MRRMTFAGVASIVFIFSAEAGAATLTVKAHLSGKDEVPPSSAHGAGELVGQVDTDTQLLTYRVTYKALTGPATGAGFSGPAARGKVGASIYAVSDASSPISGEARLTDNQLGQLHKGLWYFSVATAANPNGEIRGQLRVENADLENPSQPPSFDPQHMPASLNNR
jgi:hypothetical protein